MTTTTHTLPYTPKPRKRGIGRRILGSTVLDILTGPHGVDRYAELVRPDFSLTQARARVLDVRRPAADMVGLTLRPNNNWEGFRAGQFARFEIEVDGRWHARCYSPSRSAHDPSLIELTVRVHPDGVVSQHLHERAAPGMVVKISEPQGTFHLPDQRPEQMLMVSGGSGITPVLSMLRTLRDEGSDAKVTFLHYARSAEHVPYREELERLADSMPNVTLAIVHTRDEAADPLTREWGQSPRGQSPDWRSGAVLTGHFAPRHLTALGVVPGSAEAFVCGPAELIESVRENWESAGAAARFHSENFNPPAIAINPDDASGTIRFGASDLEVANDGRTLLEQAEAAGLAPKSGCRIGICHSCRCRVASGAVRDVRSGEVKELVDAEAQLCVSVPVSDIELEI